jgi:hypothetical protein
MIHTAPLDRLRLQRGAPQEARDRSFIIEEFTAVVRALLCGFTRVRLPSGMVLHDVAVHQKNGTSWASHASKPMLARDGTAIRDAAGKIQCSPAVSFASRALRDRFCSHVIAALSDSHPDALA